MPISNALWLGLKEWRSLWRDPVMQGLILFAFTFAIYSSATSTPETLSRATIAIVDEDQSPLSRRIIDAFYPPYFTPPVLINQRNMDKRMDAGADTFALNIPPNFQRDVLAGKQPVIQLNMDATRMSQAFTGSSYIQTMVSQEVLEFVRRYREEAVLPIDLAVRVRFNPELKQAMFGSIMEVINNITMLSIVLTGAALIREREHGTIEHLLVMPVTPLEIMVSKVCAMAIVVLVASTLSLVFVVRGLLEVPIEGSLVLFLAGTTLHLFATTSLGILMGTIARSMPQFGLLLILVLMPLEMLSGGMTPRESMPEAVQYLMLVAPTTHFVEFAQAILYRGAGLKVVWPEFLSITVIGFVMFLLSLARFRRAITTLA